MQTKSRQTLLFDPGGCTGRLRSCQVLGEQHALRMGWARLDAVMVAAEARAFWYTEELKHHFQERPSDSYVLRAIAVSHTDSR